MRYENRHWQSAVHAKAENRSEFLVMLFERRLGPEQRAHVCELISVGTVCLSDLDGQLLAPLLFGWVRLIFVLKLYYGGQLLF